MSIHADDEFSLRIALESELDDVLPRDGLAGLVIARHRKVRRRRVAGVVSLVVVFAGIGVPLGIASTSGGAPDGAAARSGPVALRLGSYTLTLPGQYHLSDAKTAPCATGAGAVSRRTRPSRPAYASSCSSCRRRARGRPGRTCRAVPGRSPSGRYRAWLAPSGYLPSGDGPAPVPTALVIEGDGRDLVIGASGLSRSALVSLVSAGLAAA